MRVSGLYSAMRRTTSAAFTRALSTRKLCEPWPGVPVTRRVHQKQPFSATISGSFSPPGVSVGMPPDSVMT